MYFLVQGDIMKINPTDLAGVIESLIKTYPERLPKGKISMEEIHIRIGNQQVINHLLDHYDRITSK